MLTKRETVRLAALLCSARAEIDAAIAAVTREALGGEPVTQKELAGAVEACFFAANCDEAQKVWD